MTKTFPADASPEKRLFISLLTRDISMVAAFLDLIDNSVNATLEPFAEKLQTADDYAEILEGQDVKLTDIKLTISTERIEIVDTAPGISLEAACSHVFKFGRSQDEENESDRLSVYGLGLKRAFFKLGRLVKITSDHVDGGFELDLDVSKWSKDKSPRWEFDLLSRDAAMAKDCGTRIEISDLYQETQKRLSDGVFEGQLQESIGKTYAYFLTKFVRIFVNEKEISPTNLRVGSNNSTDRFQVDEVTCAITAGLGTPEAGKYRDKGSGWFVFCNGRTVISADKSPMTGWNSGLPIFQPKHRPFLGTVHFVSKHADKLPWDTTKSGINEDSEIWQEAKRLMIVVGRSVISFLDSRYTDEGTEIAQKELADATKDRIDPMKASVAGKKTFAQPERPPKTEIRIQYDAQIKDVRRVSEYLLRPEMSGSDVGRHTFNFFLRNEVGED